MREKAHTVTDHQTTQRLRAEEVQPKQAMSIVVQVLLTFLVLSACLGDVVTPWTHTLRTNMLKESIKLLDQLQQMEVSCNEMNVTNIFADYKVRKNPSHIALMGTGRILGARGEHSTVEGRREARDPACPGVVLGRSKEPTVTPSTNVGLPSWFSPLPMPCTGALTFPHPSSPPAKAALVASGHSGDMERPEDGQGWAPRDNNMEILCKAATIAQEGQSCHRYLEGIYHNLLSLVWGSRARHKKPCPAAAGSTTSLKNFLKELHQVLQEEYKSQKKICCKRTGISTAQSLPQAQVHCLHLVVLRNEVVYDKNLKTKLPAQLPNVFEQPFNLSLMFLFKTRSAEKCLLLQVTSVRACKHAERPPGYSRHPLPKSALPAQQGPEATAEIEGSEQRSRTTTVAQQVHVLEDYKESGQRNSVNLLTSRFGTKHPKFETKYQLVTLTAAFAQTQQCLTSAYEYLQKSLTVEQADNLPRLRKLKDNQDKQLNAVMSVPHLLIVNFQLPKQILKHG
ncbi:hypothetical protein IHE44_0003760 [Lamprotornis superbus]|uniref:Uncharacterized protein n=1 Tax=Lamprotornis superbus TaxID=245042 RepID=A0A835TPA9_9PASS|nr:hypothetical protein IHE44_0003760 [Lamprotornis superbus]